MRHPSNKGEALFARNALINMTLRENVKFTRDATAKNGLELLTAYFVQSCGGETRTALEI